ncbi:hypothetical protein ACMGDH_15485 [Sphingomonas sp. DT-207]|uniref:hypothetical protein n=1 Tax=Sphingomonas sp. DT-207 TaxID=3396167 RepID=UPI003F1B3BAE
MSIVPPVKATVADGSSASTFHSAAEVSMRSGVAAQAPARASARKEKPSRRSEGWA